MTDPKPTPLTPFGCDMSGNDWYPLHFMRLRESRWWRSASHLARSINIDLWGRAYQQIPAGSLPDDDIDLADWAGFGRDVQSWLKVKAEVMAPWVICTDGRWYHPTLCEVVMDAWERLGEARRKAREKKAAQRLAAREGRRIAPLSPDRNGAALRDGPPGPQGQPPTSPGTSGEVPRDRGGDNTTCPPKIASYNTEQTVGTSYLVASRPEEQGDEPVISAVRPPRSETAAMASDIEFAELWNIATPVMRRRGKSQARVFKAWRQAVKRQRPALIVMALRRYVTEDEDVKRGMGQPGLQRWLADHAYDEWLATSSGIPGVTDDRWRMMVEFFRDGTPWPTEMGPEPGATGCRVPPAILGEFGFQRERSAA